jgi:hypothetical protein
MSIWHLPKICDNTENSQIRLNPIEEMSLIRNELVTFGHKNDLTIHDHC